MTIPQIRLKLAQRLRFLRNKAGLTQEEVAETTGFSVRYYQMLESRKPPAVKIDGIGKIAKALKTSPSKLLNFKR